MYVASPRRHVDHKVVELTPINITYKLAYRAAHHRTAPYHGLLFINEQPDAHHFNPEFFYWHNQPFSIYLTHHWPITSYSKHDVLTWPIDICIHETNFRSAMR